MPPVIQVKGLIKTYVVGEVEVRALRGVNLEVQRGEFIAVTGASGSGKSTFMHIVGVVEIIAGIIVLTRFTRIGSIIVGLWLLGIIVNILTTGMFYDLAVRDFEIAVGAFALSRITAYREEAQLGPTPAPSLKSELMTS